MSSAPPVPPSPEDLTSTFGVLLIGFIFAVVLCGLTFFQTYIYFTRFPSDSRGTKMIVSLLWAMDTTATTLISHTIYRYLITFFMVPFDELQTTRTFIAEQATAVFTIFVVQSYYTFRVWSVCDRKFVVPAVICALSVVSAGLNLTGVASMVRQHLFYQIVGNIATIFRGIGSGLALVADIAIVASTFWYMQPSRNPGMVQTTDWYEKVVVYGFNRGTAFTVMQAIALIVFLSTPHAQTWVLFNWIASKIYVNSILAMLNFRNTHRGCGVHEEDSLNQAASNRSGSVSRPPGARETTRSVQFSVDPDVKNGDPMSVIELDMVGSHVDVDDDDDVSSQYRPASGRGVSHRDASEQSGKHAAEWLNAGGPSSKRRDLDDDS